jgi:hypothetical protein
LVLLFALVDAQQYKFCTDGVSQPDFADDQIVEVLFAQAPLFSTNPKVGQKLRKLNMFHSCIVFAQGANSSRKYWTLEFDATASNLFLAVAPKVTGSGLNASIEWDSDARYCLSPGLKWGHHHWTEHFDIVTSLSSSQAMAAFTGFVSLANGTVHGSQPQYQLWRAARTHWFSPPDTLLRDVTCNDGSVWFLNYLASSLNAPMPPNFKFKGTSAVVKAHQLEKVDLTDPTSKLKMLHFYRTMRDTVSANKSMFHRLVDVVELLLEHKYLYDSTHQVYYEVIGNFVPWIEFQYTEFPLEAFPWPTQPAANAASFVSI